MAELGELADLGDLSDFKDPIEKEGGLENVLDKVEENIKTTVNSSTAFNQPSLNVEVKGKIPEIASESVKSAISNIPSDNIAGKQIQKITSDRLAQPVEGKNLHDASLADAIDKKGGNISAVTTEDVKAAYDNNAKVKVQEVKTEFKHELTGAIDGSVPEAKLSSGQLVEGLTEHPVETKATLDAEASKIEAEDPNWKDKLSEGGKKVLGYGGKALLVLAVVGAIVPGADGPIKKLASLGGDVAAKVIDVAAGIIGAFIGPIVANVAKFFGKFKVPLIIICIVLIIGMARWAIRTVKGDKKQ